MENLEHFYAVEHRKDLMQDSSTFRLAPHRTEPKTVKLGKHEAHKQMDADVAGTASLEWALLFLFVPQKAVSFQFGADFQILNKVASRMRTYYYKLTSASAILTW